MGWQNQLEKILNKINYCTIDGFLWEPELHEIKRIMNIVHSEKIGSEIVSGIEIRKYKITYRRKDKRLFNRIFESGLLDDFCRVRKL